MRKERVSLQSEVFTRAVADMILPDEFVRTLAGNTRMRIKHGIDATASGLHIGHATSLWKLRALQEAGHKAVIILGDFTTAIGDPTGKSKARPLLPRAEIAKHIRSIEREIRGILLQDPAHLEIRRNSEWYAAMRLSEFLRLLSCVTHARLIERDMFQERIKRGEEIWMHELVYPILQGYDSVAVRADLTVIGSDQLFNEHMGRFFQEKFGQPPQGIVALTVLPGPDGGEKMSKSAGNVIGLSDSPRDKFGKAMRLRDALVIPYLIHYTDVPLSEVRMVERRLKEGGNPMEAKLFFAEALVRRYHGAVSAGKERGRFLQVFSRNEVPADIPWREVVKDVVHPVDLLVVLRLAPSRSAARQLLLQGAVRLGGTIIRDPRHKLSIRDGVILSVGKRRTMRLRVKK